MTDTSDYWEASRKHHYDYIRGVINPVEEQPPKEQNNMDKPNPYHTIALYEASDLAVKIGHLQDRISSLQDHESLSTEELIAWLSYAYRTLENLAGSFHDAKQALEKGADQ